MPESCQAYSNLMIAVPVLCVLSVVHRAPERGLAWCVMVGALLYHLFCFLVALVLGNVGLLSPQSYRWSMAAFAAGLLAAAVVQLPALGRALLRIRYRPALQDVPLAAAAWIALRVFYHDWHFNWAEGPLQFDALNYHIPRALQWVWHGSFAPFRTSIWQQVAHAFGGTAVSVSPVFLGCGWLGSAFNTQVFTVGASAAVAVIGRALGLSGRGAVAASLAFLSFPAVGLRLADISTDMAAAFPVLAATALFFCRDSLRQGAFLFVALVGLGTACKQYVAFPTVPIAVILFWPLRRKMLERRVLAALLAGLFVGAFFCVLSFYPIYQNFGDLSGGGTARSLTTLDSGWAGVSNALGFTFVGWFSEPLVVVPQPLRGELFQGLALDRLFALWGVPSAETGPELDYEHIRSGFLPLILVPWLLLAVPRGRRWGVLAVFAAICLAQFSILAANHVGARFALVPLAAFALLWGARVSLSLGVGGALASVAASAMIAFALWCDLGALQRWHAWADRYVPEREQNREVSEAVRGDTVLLLSRGLSTDAMVAGRRADLRFEYLNCPLDGDWTRMLSDLREGHRWLLFAEASGPTVPGPTYESLLGPPCSEITTEELRQWLQAAGWKHSTTTSSRFELWSAN